MEHVRSNHPNAAKLISSLRNTGYDSYAAVEDIIDNSIDAHARSIKVFVEHNNKDLKVIITDDGIGMNESVLDEALKLGSISDKDEVSDLGKFGMGLCTASISMARRLEVITKEKNGECLYSCQDLDEIIKKNEFIKVLRPASKEEKTLFEDLVGKNNGSMIVLSNIDRLSDTNTSQFATKLARDLGRIYRKFIESGINLFVNNKKIEINDPLAQDNKETKVYSDEVYELPTNAIGGRKEKIRVKIAILPEVNKELEKELKMNIRNQGFYVLRNNREVAAGASLGVFDKHNDFNRLRMELSFSATLDNEMGVRFSKDGVDPNQAISDFLKQELGGQVASIRKVIVKARKSDEASDVNHSESEQVIAQRAKLLITPEAEVEKRGPRKDKDDDKKGDKKTSKDRQNFRETKTSPKGMGARFEIASMGKEGTLYECYQEGKIIVIRWNVDHPFYERVVITNKENKNIVSGIDYLIFAMASAELKSVNDDNVGLIETIKSIMSSNLRALLS